MDKLTPRRHVEISLRGGHSHRVPMTIYESLIPQCVTERELRNRGMCIVRRDVNVYKTRQPNVKSTQEIRWDDGRRLVRTWYETPVGKVSSLTETNGGMTWRREKLLTPLNYPLCL